MSEEETALNELREALAKRNKKKFKRTELLPTAPAPQLDEVVKEHGEDLTAAALLAWQSRVDGVPIIDVAHQLGLSINSAKELIRQAHGAIYEDLKENLSLNRQLDLDRVDGLLRVFYPLARQGDLDSANLTLKALTHRAKLTGVEAPPDPGRSNPANVLVWIQTQLPSINKIVDSLPLELPPAAP